MQLIQHNPARDVIVPRKQQKEKTKIKFLDRQELKQFLHAGKCAELVVAEGRCSKESDGDVEEPGAEVFMVFDHGLACRLRLGEGRRPAVGVSADGAL